MIKHECLVGQIVTMCNYILSLPNGQGDYFSYSLMFNIGGRHWQTTKETHQ